MPAQPFDDLEHQVESVVPAAQALRQLGLHIENTVVPASLAFRSGIDLVQSCP